MITKTSKPKKKAVDTDDLILSFVLSNRAISHWSEVYAVVTDSKKN